MSERSPFNVSFPPTNCSKYRGKRSEEWSPQSQESKPDPCFDSDEENYESNMTSISSDCSSGLSSFDSPLPWAENSSFSNPSTSKSLVLQSRGNKGHHEGKERTEWAGEYVRRSNSLVIGKRSRAIGLKDMDLTGNIAAKYIREAKEANKSPSKKRLFSPLSKQMSCPTFSTPFDGLFDRHKVTGRASQTGKASHTSFGRVLNLELDSQTKSPLVDSSAEEVLLNLRTHSVKLFSCADEKGIPKEEFDHDWWERCKRTNTPVATQSSNELFSTFAPKVMEFIDLTVNDVLSDGEASYTNRNSEHDDIAEKAGDVCVQNTSHRSYPPVSEKASMKKRVFSFSDDEDSDSGTKCQLKSDKESSEESLLSDPAPQRKRHSLQGFVKMSMVFFLCALSLSVYLHTNPHGFCLDSEFTSNISGIGSALKSELFGQHIAQKIVTAALKNHFNSKNIRKPLVLAFHGWTGIGKNFVSNIITEHFFKRKTNSPFVHKFIIPLHFPHESEVEMYNQQLFKWIRGNVSHCRKGGLFIFDEMDKIHIGMMDTIKAVLLDYQGKKVESGHQNVIFMFLSNSGGEAINQHVLRHILDGKLRESLMLSELEVIFHDIAKRIPNIWFADLLKSEVIDYLVPFLPLERTHVKQCIRRELVKKGYDAKEPFITEIANQMDYFPESHQFFSVSGCKKVSSRVDVIME